MACSLAKMRLVAPNYFASCCSLHGHVFAVKKEKYRFHLRMTDELVKIVIFTKS